MGWRGRRIGIRPVTIDKRADRARTRDFLDLLAGALRLRDNGSRDVPRTAVNTRTMCWLQGVAVSHGAYDHAMDTSTEDADALRRCGDGAIAGLVREHRCERHRYRDSLSDDAVMEQSSEGAS